MRIALGIEYDGMAFCGWQSQAQGGSVQDALESAMMAVAGMPVRTICAGRTDAGVHAINQVVHFDAPLVRPLSAWVRGVNAHLPPSVAVRWAKPVAEDFHARFSAQSRTYRYLLQNRPERPGLLHGKVGWYHRVLDVELMRAASACLVGEHDFSSFRAAQCQARSPVKTLYAFEIAREGDLIRFDCRANAFLHHMVRNLVGALVYVGSGRLSPADFAGLLAARDRRLAPPTFCAEGLYLVSVEYDAAWGLPVEEGV